MRLTAMYPLGRLLALLAIALVAFLAVPMPAWAAPASVSRDTSDFTFDSFDAQYELSRDAEGVSRLSVVETIVARFPDFDQNRGIIRAIPDDYDGVDLDTRVLSVTDENGTPVPFEEEQTGDFVELALGTDDFVYGAVTYVISYEQRDVVRAFADTASDEFYWDINGTGWPQPFDRVSARLTVAPDLVPALSGASACYAGASGDNNVPCEITSDGGTFTAIATDLDGRENLSIAVGFESGTFATVDPRVPEPLTPADSIISGLLGALGLGAIGTAIASRVRAKKSDKGRGIIVPQYSEPDDIHIAQASHLMGRPTTTVPAAIVRLAVRKNIRILAYAVDDGDDPYTLQFLSDAGADDRDLDLLTVLFGPSRTPGALTAFGPEQTSLMTNLRSFSARQGNTLIPEGFQNKTQSRPLGMLMPGALAIIGIIAFIRIVTMDTLDPILLVVLFICGIGFFATIGLAISKPTLTARGAAAKEYLEGMKVYLDLAEKDRMRMLQSPEGAVRVDVGNNLEMIKLYEKLLPWAVLWGVEDRWMEELQVRVEAEPTDSGWLIGSDGTFNPYAFSMLMSTVNTSITPPPTPSSSNGWGGSGGGGFSGGSFGGGFSGGGGGGGGGGGR